MKNQVQIVLQDKEIEMITVKCEQFKVIYLTNYSSNETDVSVLNGMVCISVFTKEPFDDVLRKVSDTVKAVNKGIADGCDLVYTL